MGGALPEFDHHHIKINKKGKKNQRFVNVSVLIYNE